MTRFDRHRLDFMMLADINVYHGKAKRLCRCEIDPQATSGHCNDLQINVKFNLTVPMK